VTPRFRVGYQIHPQHCTAGQIRDAYRAADALGVDTLWVWDHLFPLYGPADGNHFACLPLLAAMAVETRASAPWSTRTATVIPSSWPATWPPSTT